MIVDIGGGTTEMALFPWAAFPTTLRIGGDAVNQAILRYMRRTYHLEIGEHTVEKAKIEIACATAPSNETYYIKGRNLSTGLPGGIDVSAKEISEAIADPLQAILEAVRATLRRPLPNWPRI